jgi:hypothetical protein
MEKLIVETYAPSDQINRVIPAPVPALRAIPEWYKNIPRYTDEEYQNRDTYSVKACVPYLDAMTAGYMLTTWCDIEVIQAAYGDDPQPILRWDSELWPVELRPLSAATGLRRINGYSHWIFSWNMPWGFKTPPGYSSLITHPLNRPDLPFITFSGMTDTDSFAVPGAATFCVSLGFEGIIPKGTPYLQVIPIKRHEWEIQVNNDLREEQEGLRNKVRELDEGIYKKGHWTKKDYH